MNYKIFFPFLLTVFISCSQQPTRNNDIYVVPQRQKPQVDIIPNEPPPPPITPYYYLTFNFIIDTSGEVYFYEHRQYGWFCGTGFDWNTPPEFIDLRPKDIVQVPINSITDFIKLNVLSLDSNDRRVAIASVKDTIQSIGLSKILAACNDNTNKIGWTFRKATQEENIVLKFKKLNRRYYPEDIKWDSTKIWFPLKIDSKTRFKPPRVKDDSLSGCTRTTGSKTGGHFNYICSNSNRKIKYNANKSISDIFYSNCIFFKYKSTDGCYDFRHHKR